MPIPPCLPAFLLYLDKIILLEQTYKLERIAEKLVLPRVCQAVDRFERKLLTDFVLSTSYLRVGNPANDAIEYYGMDFPQYCGKSIRAILNLAERVARVL